jgi:glucan 1,3-beta-glucosidase
MVNKFRCIIIILLAAAALSQAAAVPSVSADSSLHMLKAKGTFIIDSNSNTVILKGCNLGNWFAMEMWMMHLNDDKIRDQYAFELTLANRFGQQQKNRLMDMFRANWITDRDFEIIKSFGMNCVRLPIYYQLIEDDNNPMNLNPDAFKWLDYAIDTAKKYGLYTIICLHGAAGGQSNMGHCGREDYNQFWSDPINQKRTYWLWQQIAQRYKKRDCVAGYDILNEPWGADMPEQIKAFDSIYKSIRDVDREHIIFIQGHGNVEGLPYPKEKAISKNTIRRQQNRGFVPRTIDWVLSLLIFSDTQKNWKNVVYSAHCYPGIFGSGRPTPETQIRFLKTDLKKIDEDLKKYNVPFLMGEFNVLYASAGGTEMMRRHFDAYENYGWAATMWAYKVLTIPGEIRRGYWEMVTNAEPLPNIDFKTASLSEIENYFKFLSSDCVIYDELKKALTQKEPLPPLPDPLPPPPPLTSAPANDKLIGFSATDIASAIPGGQKVYSDKKIDLFGCGADIYLSNDQCRFVWKKITGDCEISATVDELTFTHMFAKAGVMIRGDLSADSIFAMLNVRPAGELEFACRYHKAEKVKTDGHLGHDFPKINLKLIRKGQTIESWHCKGNEKWEKFMTTTLPDLPQTVYVGIFCLSHDNTQLAKAAFDNIFISDGFEN